MVALINHLLQNNTKEILEKSYLNCHCKGLHSIMLLEAPGKTIRLYIADYWNHLNHNSPEQDLKQSLAFHPHHCNLTLEVLCGTLDNWTVVPDEKGNIVRDKYLYNSPISNNEMSFKLIKEKDTLSFGQLSRITAGGSISLKASDIHTVIASPKEITAWLVYEGEEDSNYIPYCWSNKNLLEEKGNGLYQRFDGIEQIKLYLSFANLL